MPKLKRKFNSKNNSNIQVFKVVYSEHANMLTYTMPKLDPSEKISTKSKPFYNKINILKFNKSKLLQNTVLNVESFVKSLINEPLPSVLG